MEYFDNTDTSGGAVEWENGSILLSLGYDLISFPSIESLTNDDPVAYLAEARSSRALGTGSLLSIEMTEGPWWEKGSGRNS